MTAPILYVRDGSRFVPLPDTLLRDCPPIPEPRRVPDEGDPHGDGHQWDEHGHRPDPDNPHRTLCHAPRCPHGHFTAWAERSDPKTGAPNCKPCHQETRRAR